MSRRLQRVWSEASTASHPSKEHPTASALTALEHRISELEDIASSQSRELRVQFERIAQLQAECDILRIRFVKP